MNIKNILILIFSVFSIVLFGQGEGKVRYSPGGGGTADGVITGITYDALGGAQITTSTGSINIDPSNLVYAAPPFSGLVGTNDFVVDTTAGKKDLYVRNGAGALELVEVNDTRANHFQIDGTAQLDQGAFALLNNNQNVMISGIGGGAFLNNISGTIGILQPDGTETIVAEPYALGTDIIATGKKTGTDWTFRLISNTSASSAGNTLTASEQTNQDSSYTKAQIRDFERYVITGNTLVPGNLIHRNGNTVNLTPLDAVLPNDTIAQLIVVEVDNDTVFAATRAKVQIGHAEVQGTWGYHGPNGTIVNAPPAGVDTTRVGFYTDNGFFIYDPDIAAGYTNNESNKLLVTQSGHGFAQFDPIFNDGSNWVKANTNSADSLHEAVVVEVVDANSFYLQVSGVLYAPGHGYGKGAYFYLQDDGTFLAVPDADFNDVVFYAIDENNLQIIDQRKVGQVDPVFSNDTIGATANIITIDWQNERSRTFRGDFSNVQEGAFVNLDWQNQIEGRYYNHFLGSNPMNLIFPSNVYHLNNTIIDTLSIRDGGFGLDCYYDAVLPRWYCNVETQDTLTYSAYQIADPSTISGLVLWYDWEQSYTNGSVSTLSDRVDSIPDLSGNANHATLTGGNIGPTWTTNGLRFASSSDPIDHPEILSATTDYTAFYVATRDAAAGEPINNVLHGGNLSVAGNVEFQIKGNARGAGIIDQGATNVRAYNNDVPLAGEEKILMFQPGKILMNNVEETYLNSDTVNGGKLSRFGGRVNVTNQRTHGWIKQAIVYDRVLTAQEIQTVTEFLNAKYNVF